MVEWVQKLNYPLRLGVRLKKVWAALGLEAPFLCLSRHKTETLQSNSNLHVTVHMNYVPQLT